MQLIVVNDSYSEKEFLQLPRFIYKDDPSWIPPLIQDIKKVFDPQKNKYYKDGELIRYILQKDGRTIGRIAAFVHDKELSSFPMKLRVIGID